MNKFTKSLIFLSIWLLPVGLNPTAAALELTEFGEFGGRRAERLPQARFGVSQWGSSFSGFNGVRLDDPLYRTQNGSAVSGNQRLAPVSSTLWSAHLSYPIRRATFGAALSGPFGEMRRFRASTPYDFVALRDATTDTQFKAALLGAVEIMPSTLYLRGGAQFFISSSGSAEAVIIGNNPTARFAADVGLNSAALLGLSYETQADEWGFSFRQEMAPKITQGFSGQIAIGNLQTFEQPILFRSVLYFEPHQLEAFWRHDFGQFAVRAGVTYEMWSRYQPAFLTAETKDTRGNPVVTQVPTITLANTLNPEVSVSTETLLPFSVGLAYRFAPTPLRDTSGPTNFIDSDLQRIRLRAATSLKELGFPSVRAELIGDFGWWSRKEVKKAQPNFVGAPGYTIQGERYRVETRLVVAL